ncbi:hypothetical protein [Demequina sp.]|uniref:hypothetical protein n=1 Tax=Demequina sp. TaxID=2050685 RepID=UPI0025BB8C02|nr:hypothetical protein [Demequina sp.]
MMPPAAIAMRVQTVARARLHPTAASPVVTVRLVVTARRAPTALAVERVPPIEVRGMAVFVTVRRVVTVRRAPTALAVERVPPIEVRGMAVFEGIARSELRVESATAVTRVPSTLAWTCPMCLKT